MAFTRPKASQINFDVTNISDPLIRLNSAETGSADKDVGIVIERGDDTNVAIIYDESANEFAVINTTETGTTSGNVTIASYADIRAGAATFAGTLSAGATDVTTLTATGLATFAGSLTGGTVNGAQAFTYDGSGNHFFRNNAGQALLGIISTTSGTSILQLGDTAAFSAGQVAYSNSTDAMSFNTASTLALTLDSSQNATFAGAIAMGTNKITGMGDPTSAQDAATKAYVDSQSSGAASDSTAGVVELSNSAENVAGVATDVVPTVAGVKEMIDTHVPAPDLDDVNARIMQNAFQIAVNGGLSVRNMADGVVDVFTDETGVDTATSTNETYDAAGDYYHNPATGGYGSDIIPVMTTNTAPSGEASDSGTASDAWQAFNDTSDNYQWLYGSPRWIQYAFDSGVTKTPTRVKLTATNAGPNIGGAPSSWNLVASNTGDFSGEETTLHSVAGEAAWSLSEVRTYTFTNTTAYRYFRLNITANQGHPAFSGVAEFELNESAGAPDMTLVSNATTALAQPDSAFLVLHHEPVDAVTLNTDVKAYASRDGGTTYSQGTLSKATDLSGNQDILIADVDFTGDPDGTSMKWKVETLNNTEQRLRAIAHQWS